VTEEKQELQEQEVVEEEATNHAESGGEQDDTGRSFTQAELDAIIADRISRVKKQYGDYDELKDKASKWEEHEIEQMDELERAQKRIADAEAAAEQANQQASETLVLASVIAEASKAGALYPEDAFNLIDRSGVKVEGGKVEGVADAVKTLVEAGRLVMRRTSTPNLDGGKGSGEREREKKSEATDEEASIARKLGLTIEQYLAGKKK